MIENCIINSVTVYLYPFMHIYVQKVSRWLWNPQKKYKVSYIMIGSVATAIEWNLWIHFLLENKWSRLFPPRKYPKNNNFSIFFDRFMKNIKGIGLSFNKFFSFRLGNVTEKPQLMLCSQCTSTRGIIKMRLCAVVYLVNTIQK